MLPLPSQDPQTQSMQAADEILLRIATLELPAGEWFTERQLAERIGMGKVPVREALLRLSGTGLITPRTGSCYEIAPITLRSARDVFDAWRVVEPAAVDLVVQRGTAARIAKELRATRDLSDDTALAECQFHMALTIASGNPHLGRAHPGLELSRLLVLARQWGTPEPGCGTAAHDRLLKALLKDDPEASDVARDNIDAVQGRVLEALASADPLHTIHL